MFYEQKMTSLGTGESRKRPKRGQKRPGRGQKRSGRGQEEARKRAGRGPEDARKRPGTGQERPRKVRNSEFGEKLLETQCFMNRK